MTGKLLLCPFCGSDAEVYSAVTRIPNDDGSLQGHWVVDCTSCNASIEFNGSPEEAVKNWNTRAQPKYKRVDLDGYSISPRDEEKYEDLIERIIDDIKSKYGDLYVEVKE